MWLRFHHTVNDKTGEHPYRAASSRYGEAWRWGATWTLPADSAASVGLYAGGGETPAVTAAFDCVRFLDAR